MGVESTMGRSVAKTKVSVVKAAREAFRAAFDRAVESGASVLTSDGTKLVEIAKGKKPRIGKQVAPRKAVKPGSVYKLG
jgi:hypothetical protein